MVHELHNYILGLFLLVRGLCLTKRQIKLCSFYPSRCGALSARLRERQRPARPIPPGGQPNGPQGALRSQRSWMAQQSGL